MRQTKAALTYLSHLYFEERVGFAARCEAWLNLAVKSRSISGFRPSLDQMEES